MPLLLVSDRQAGIRRIMDAKIHLTQWEARMFALLIDDSAVAILEDQQAIKRAEPEKYWSY
jgi:hypothetical protein